MTFHDFITTKYPLYVNHEMKVNLTVSQLCELVEEWENMITDDLTFEELENIDNALKDVAAGETMSFEEFKKQLYDEED